MPAICHQSDGVELPFTQQGRREEGVLMGCRGALLLDDLCRGDPFRQQEVFHIGGQGLDVFTRPRAPAADRHRESPPVLVQPGAMPTACVAVSTQVNNRTMGSRRIRSAGEDHDGIGLRGRQGVRRVPPFERAGGDPAQGRPGRREEQNGKKEKGPRLRQPPQAVCNTDDHQAGGLQEDKDRNEMQERLHAWFPAQTLTSTRSGAPG